MLLYLNSFKGTRSKLEIKILVNFKIYEGKTLLCLQCKYKFIAFKSLHLRRYR